MPTTATERPVIGLTLDVEKPDDPRKSPFYTLRQNYVDAVTRAGGLALGLPHEPELAVSYLDRIDGLIVTGGAFDVDPALYGAEGRHATVTTKERRTAFEWAITRAALDADRPVLGICGGQQLLAVVLGGTLIQHIPDSVVDCLPHEQPNPRTEAGHTVRIEANTLLYRITDATELPVNSAHHQAVASVPEGVVVSARAPDSVIEAIEQPGKRFCLGVQWHPEYRISPGDDAIMAAFVAACGSRA